MDGVIFDNEGRIKEVHIKLHNGHSVCNYCGKDMPIVWDVVCSKCRKTFCFDHARTRDGYWICNACYNSTGK